MKKWTSLLIVLGVVSALGGCVTPSESEGSRLQRVGERTVDAVDTSGLEVLR